MDSGKEMVMQMGVREIPEDLIFEHILPRLPVKPLGQFMLVKKSWYDCIKSSRFVRKHFDFSVSSNKNDASHLLHTCLWSKDRNCGQLFTKGPNGYEKISDVKLPKFVTEAKYSFVVLGSFNGLVCLADEYPPIYGRKIYFWNPSIGKVRVNVDSTCDDLFSSYSWVGLGFWYDSEENDHKLVRLVYSGSYCHVEVYKFSTNSWRKIGYGAVNPFINSMTGGVFVDGCLYWLASYARQHGMLQVILSFDVKNGVFSSREWPFDPSSALMNYMGTLGAFVKLRTWDMRMITGGVLWVQREINERSSWKRDIKLVSQERIKFSLGITENGCLLLLTDDLRMVEYDPYEQRINHIAISEYEYYNHMSTYRETLLLLGEDTDDSAELDGYMAKEGEKENIKDPIEQLSGIAGIKHVTQRSLVIKNHIHMA